jgi:hypothetical protein
MAELPRCDAPRRAAVSTAQVEARQRTILQAAHHKFVQLEIRPSLTLRASGTRVAAAADELGDGDDVDDRLGEQAHTGRSMSIASLFRA